MSRRDKKLSGWKLVQAVLCVVLLAILGAFLIWDHYAGLEETKQLKQLAEEQEALSMRTIEHAEDLEEIEEEEQSFQGSALEVETEDLPASGIACWGDEFFRGEEAEQYSYRVILQQQLTENGYDLEVANKTLTGASTLSVMRMAGVAQTELDAYITAHKEAANGEQLPVTETGIRELTEEQLEREETTYIPVIFMGYYGGWNHDLEELIEQQQKVLDTFENKEQFLIVGVRPMDGSVTKEAYDEAMEEAWGEHYISGIKITTASITTRTAQEEIGQAVYDKLVELSYIEKRQG